MTAGPDFTSTMHNALNDVNLPGLYFKQNQEEAVEEDIGLYDYGRAAATGLYHGVALTAPETMIRVLHVLGRTANSDDMTSWARGKLDEYALLRETDPYWQPDEKWQSSYFAKSLYEGFNSIANSAVMMLPGIALTPLTGGASLGAYFLGGAFGGGTLAGIAEYDSFLDEAYKQLSPLNPNLTWEELASEQWWSALMSGFAEGGFEFAGDVFMGKAIGLFGKGGAEPARHIISKLFKNAGQAMLREVPSELVTAAAQDWIRENAGLDHQGRLEAMAQALGPAMVSGGAVGAAGTVAKQIMHPHDAKAQADAVTANLRTAELKTLYGDVGHQFLTERLKGMDQNQARAIMDVAQTQALDWAQRNGKDVNDWWTGMTAKFSDLSSDGWSDITATAQALVTPDASFESVVDASSQPLLRGLDKSQQEALTTQYGATAEDGSIGVDMDKAAADFSSWLKNPESVQVDKQTEAVFTEMRDKLSSSYGAAKKSKAVKISEQAQKMFDGLLQKAVKNTKAPPMFEALDSGTLESAITQIPNNAPEANESFASAIAKHMKFNFSPWTVGADLKAYFSAFDRALSPYMDKFLGRQSDAKADAKAKADMLTNGYTEEGINSLFGDTVDNSEGSLSQRIRKAALYYMVSEKNIQAMANAYNAEPSPRNGLALRMAIEVHKGIHYQMRGVRAETGRALRAWSTLGKDNTLDMRRLNELAEDMGGTPAFDKLAAAIANARDSQQLKSVIETTWGDKTKAMIVEHVTLGMLTNPATQLVNIFGNGLTLIQETFNRFLASGLNPNQSEGVVKGETMAMVNGFFKGWESIKTSWANHKQAQGGGTWNALKNINEMEWQGAGSSILDDGGLKERQLNFANAQEVIGAVLPGQSHLSSAHAAATDGLATMVDYYGSALGVVSKGLLGVDMVFKTLAYHMELNARAHRRATQASLDGSDFEANYRKYTDKALKEDKDAAMEFAKKVTFQSDLGAIGRGINKIRQEAPLTRLMIPFLKTPINIIKYGAAHTPGVASLFKETKAELASQDNATRQLAEARIMTGTMLLTAAFGLAAQGMLTGNGPADPEERRRLQATGWQPNSLKLGDTYIGIDRLDPGAFLFNTAASFFEISQHLDGEDAEKAISAAWGAAMRTVTQRSYLQSIQSILDAVMQPDSPEGRRAQRDLIGNLLVPASALSRTTARVIDPIAHETDTVFNQLRAGIPGFSMAAPIRRNFLGEAMEAPEMLGPDHVSPFRTSADKQDRVYDEISRLGRAGQDVPGTPQRTWTVGNKKVRLDAEQFSNYLALSGTGHKINGRTLKEFLGGLVGSQLYDRATDEQKANLIKSAVSSYRDAAKKQMIQTDPGVRYLLGL